MHDIVVLTDERYVDPTETNPYIKNVLLEDRLVTVALEELGLSVKRLAWSDPEFDWGTAGAILFRSTWDYADRFTEFTDWLMKVSSKTKMINPFDLIVWNLDKHYLFDLKGSGINIVETHFIEPNDKRSLADLHEELGLSKTVLKPAVSAAAKDTFKLNSSSLDEVEKRYASLIENESMLLQPFQESVLSRGELSLMVFGGQFSHAVLKKAKAGDFRVQDDFGGTVHAYEPTKEEIRLAINAVKACETLPLYARVDIVTDNMGLPAVSELELIEPELWFRRHEPAADLLASAIKKALD